MSRKRVLDPSLQQHLETCSNCGGRRVEDWDSRRDRPSMRLVDPEFLYCDDCRSKADGWTEHTVVVDE